MKTDTNDKDIFLKITIGEFGMGFRFKESQRHIVEEFKKNIEEKVEYGEGFHSEIVYSLPKDYTLDEPFKEWMFN